MEFVSTLIDGAFEIRLNVHSDPRGRFKRHYCERDFAAAGLATRYVQANHSVTFGRGSIRGLHFQRPPAPEDKVVSCTYGLAFDVAVDLRRNSPTFLAWAALELDDTKMFYIPKGCAHGFQTLADETHLLYLHSEYYAPEAEGGIRFDDPVIAIPWPLAPTHLSERDRRFPLLDASFVGIDP